MLERCVAGARRALRARRPPVRDGQRRLRLRRAARRGRVPASDHREARALPAFALSIDAALLTAIGNDTDFSHVFVDQLELLARPDDVALGISTSGASANVNRALRRARDKGLLTIGFAGRDGGQMPALCEYASSCSRGRSIASRRRTPCCCTVVGSAPRRPGRRRCPLTPPTLPFAHCPLPISRRRILIGHGSGGKLTAQLVEELIVPAFRNPALERLDDQARARRATARASPSPPTRTW